MKKFSKLLALVLVLALVFSLTACTKGPSIAGTWKYTLDFKQAMELAGDAGVEGLESMGESFAQVFDGLSLIIILDLKPDGTYSFYWDEDAAKAAVESMVSKLREVFPALMAEMVGMSEEEMMSTLEAAGMSMDDLIEQSMGEVDTEEMVKELSENSSKGTYRYADGKLYLTEEGKAENPNDYLVVELNGNELKVVDVPNDTDLDDYKALLPMVFKK